MQDTKNILIVAGDVSGDVHAANLIKQLKELMPDVKIASIGGLRMKALSDNFLFDLVSKTSVGFIDPLKKLPQWIKLMKLIKNYLDEQKPACVITVDFYGFNHQVLGIAKHRNIPAYYYVCPQVWASRRYRAKTIVRLAKKMFVIFPFEKDIYTNLGGDAVFLGHPLVDTVPMPLAKTFDADKNKAYKIGLLPGSRPSELAKHTKLFYDSFIQLKKQLPNAQAYLFAVQEASDQQYYDLLGQKPADLHIVRETDYAQRSQMDFVITCSGTATLENALLGLPMGVVYKTSWITYNIVKLIIKVPYISLVNILSNRPVVREFIQKDANPTEIAADAVAILTDKQKFDDMRAAMLALRAQLGQSGAAKRSAQTIIGEVFPNA